MTKHAKAATYDEAYDKGYDDRIKGKDYKNTFLGGYNLAGKGYSFGYSTAEWRINRGIVTPNTSKD